MDAGFSRYLRAIAAFAAIYLAALPMHADEFDSIRGRLLAVRSQDDFARIYKGIERASADDTTRIVKSLGDSGFSCSSGSGYVRANCVFAYCGDRSALLFFRKELMTIAVYITERDVSTAVARQPVRCPATDALLKETQQRLAHVASQ